MYKIHQNNTEPKVVLVLLCLCLIHVLIFKKKSSSGVHKDKN